MDIDDDAAALPSAVAAEEDSMMAIDSSQPPLGAAAEDATMSDAAEGDEAHEGDAEMSEAVEDGGEGGEGGDGEDEVMLVEEEGGPAGEVATLESARMSPVATGGEGEVEAVPIPVDAPTPAPGTAAATSVLVDGSSWPPAPTDVPPVPSALPDALSVLATTHHPAGELGHTAVDAAGEGGSVGTAQQAEIASVKAEAPESVAPTEFRAEVATEAGTEGAEASGAIVNGDAPAHAGAEAVNGIAHGEDEHDDTAEYEQEHVLEHADYDEDTTEDLLPPILLHFGASIRPLFFPLPSDVELPETPAGEDTAGGAGMQHEPLLADRADDLLFVPLETFFAELRKEAGPEWAEDQGVDIVLEQKDVQLTISENDKQTTHLTLNDIVALHARLGCPTPLSFQVSHRPENFYRRYRMILKMLDDRELSEPGDDGEEGEEEEEHTGENGGGQDEEDELEGEEGEHGEEVQEEGEGDAQGDEAGVTGASTGAVSGAEGTIDGSAKGLNATQATSTVSVNGVHPETSALAASVDSAPPVSEQADALANGTTELDQAADKVEVVQQGQPPAAGDSSLLADDDQGRGSAAGDVPGANGAAEATAEDQAQEDEIEEGEDGEEEAVGGEEGEYEGEGEEADEEAEQEEAVDGEDEHDDAEVEGHGEDAYGLDSTVAAAEREADSTETAEGNQPEATDRPSPNKRPLVDDDDDSAAVRNVKRKVSGLEAVDTEGSAALEQS